MTSASPGEDAIGAQAPPGPEVSRADRIASRFSFQLIALGVLFYATGPVLARASAVNGVVLSFWRLWFGVGVFALALLAHRLSGRSLGSRRGWKLAALAGLAFSLNQVMFFSAIKRTSVVDASLMSTLSPIVVALISVPLFNERPAPTFRLWSGLAMVGAAVVVAGGAAGPTGDPLGMTLAIGATVFFAVFFLISKHARDELPVVAFLGVAMASAAVVVSGYATLTSQPLADIGRVDLGRAFAMATIPGALGHVVMTWPLRYVPANIPPLLRLAGPAVSGFLAWVFLGEGITWYHLVGGAIVMAGQAGAVLSRAGRDLVASSRHSAARSTRVPAAEPR